MIIDTHCHFYLPEFRTDIYDVINRAREEGIKKFYLPSIDSKVIDDMLKLVERFDGLCYPMMGLHPCSVSENYVEELRIVEDWLLKKKFFAVGEIGLDFFWNRTFEQQQYAAFHQQIEWALHFKLPIVIHSRNSTRECTDIVKEHQDGRLKGIFHCFSGNYESAMEIIDAGFLLGIGGVITFKNGGLAEALKDVPLESMVLETDSPYLAPVPFRGKRNESSYLKYVVAKLAAVKDVSVEEVSAITTANAEKIFGS